MTKRSGGLHEAIGKVTDRNAPDGAWVIANVVGMGVEFDFWDEGVGIESFKKSLPDDCVCFCLFSCRLTYEGVPNVNRIVFIHWKGPNVRGMKMVKSNQLTQMAWDVLEPHHGQLEVLNKSEITKEVLLQKLDPRAGTHVV
ncbi:hypothetical protein EIN_419380 [Entamoeba invadens IP1]|uniref:ADF-H domain-containing protein n=1 Tax=Entamoeba invadens IP1 TaxID=370355 RepID=A0A0A1U1W1_ENTIV|nr:hypothetical protein EIN_419380 [Entamoeba invadens IP1]ELP88009.1 hypothetical protein EIN_419380 [Entamoeba invadens IP1]|eukprot:XP_004254780.1 hypothetical protein EIN_419380 [Entamoeba invadens IP1]